MLREPNFKICAFEWYKIALKALKQARKPPNYASSKLPTTDPPTDQCR